MISVHESRSMNSPSPLSCANVDQCSLLIGRGRSRFNRQSTAGVVTLLALFASLVVGDLRIATAQFDHNTRDGALVQTTSARRMHGLPERWNVIDYRKLVRSIMTSTPCVSPRFLDGCAGSTSSRRSRWRVSSQGGSGRKRQPADGGD